MVLDEKTKTAVKDILSSIKAPLDVYLFREEDNEYGMVVEDLIKNIADVSKVKLYIFSMDSEEAKKQRSIINQKKICKKCFFSCDLYSTIESSFSLTMKMGLIQYLLKLGIIKNK